MTKVQEILNFNKLADDVEQLNPTYKVGNWDLSAIGVCPDGTPLEGFIRDLGRAPKASAREILEFCAGENVNGTVVSLKYSPCAAGKSGR